MKNDLKEQIVNRLTESAILRLVMDSGLEVRRKGREHVILCPAHADKTPSCYINTQKNKAGLFKCFSCGWSADIFGFVEQVQGCEFKAAMHWIAGAMGIGESRQATVNTAPRPVIEHASKVEVLTPDQIYEEMTRLQAGRLPDSIATGRLGVRAEALDAMGMFFCTERGREILVAPMRRPDGTLSSLRFRCSETKKRWSLDRKDPVTKQQVARSESGLITHMQIFDSGPAPHTTTIIIEGETDVLAATSMLIDGFGFDPRDWPGMPIGLPGVMSCHDMLTKDIVGERGYIFFDQDGAGRRATFDYRPRNKYDLVELENKPTQGLLHKLMDRGVKAVAAFPPVREDGEKVDLRDMYKQKCSWLDLMDHFMATGTRDIYGSKL